MTLLTASAVCEFVVCAFMGLLAAILLWKIATNQIDLRYVICDGQGYASMSRFQLLIFTFVVAMSLFIVATHGEKPAFPEIPAGVLGLLGISASSFLVSKSIGAGTGSETPSPEGTQSGQTPVAGGPNEPAKPKQ